MSDGMGSEEGSLLCTDVMLAMEGSVDARERTGLFGGTTGYSSSNENEVWLGMLNSREDRGWDWAVRRRFMGRGAGVEEVLGC
jgi:hypothetical protein